MGLHSESSEGRAMPYVFSPLHIDIARNSTDDFNLFHDKNRWQFIQGNPFAGPIVLGFQLQCLIEFLIQQFRQTQHELSFMHDHGLRYSNYQMTFANAIKPHEPIEVQIKPSKYHAQDNILSNRILVKSANNLVMTGFKKESSVPLFLREQTITRVDDLMMLPDRSFLPDSDFFLKRKFLNTANGKNFLLAALVEQTEYFDELENRVKFPEMYAVALISCALLERARLHNHDFRVNPMVYAKHLISVDREVNQRLKSNDTLNILVGAAIPKQNNQPLEAVPSVTTCLAFTGDNECLYRAEITMASLETVQSSKTNKIKAGVI